MAFHTRSGIFRLMTEGTSNRNREHWQAKARQVARKVNLAWWLETLSAPMLMASILGAVALIVVRREIPHVQPWLLSASIIAGIVLIALGCWAAATRKFEKPSDSMVRMEAAMRMRNSLSAAIAGVAPWPTPVEKIDAGLSWQWPRLLVPLLGTIILLASGLLIPVSARASRTTGNPEEPQAWKQLTTELDRLTKEEVVDEKYLEDTRKKIEQLKAQEEDQWFSHSSLEATDSLKKAHKAESERVERELGKAEKALGVLGKNAAGMNPAEKNRLMEEFDQALQGLQNGAMKPNPELLEQMKELGENGQANLTPEQMEQMRENLKKHAEAMKDGQGGGEGEDWSDELLAGDGDGNGNGNGDDDDGDGDGEVDGDGNGKGGVDRGPGHANGVLGAEKEGVETGKITGIEAKDLSQSTPGDLLELQDGEHDVDKSASSISAGGNIDATGKGGDRVWREALDPAEQMTLKRFFE
jgi:hypothetical protein